VTRKLRARVRSLALVSALVAASFATLSRITADDADAQAVKKAAAKKAASSSSPTRSTVLTPIAKPTGVLESAPGTVTPAATFQRPIVAAALPPAAAMLRGYVDLHTHPMSYLGFGRKAVHGAPDGGMIIPAGTRGCNPTPIRSTSMQDALGDCNGTHGGWGVDNTCGDYLRAAVINLALDGGFRGKVGFDRNLHGDHEHAGYPNFPMWPHHSSLLHQQMWWEWLRRARDSGLRAIVALTVNSETLAEVLNGDAPYDDKSVADVQIAETRRFVSQHDDFMEIAYSAADLRKIAGAGKLAVILGMEVDKLGNFGKRGVRSDEQAVRAEIQRLYRAGIRYMFPIHLIDNAFGGSAVYEMLFNFANKHQNGYHYRVTTDTNIGYSASLTSGPLGAENGLILGLHGLLLGVGEIPAPCMNDLLKCQPPPGKVRCCGSFESVVSILEPSPELDAYKVIPKGHVNSLGLTRLGEIAINEMMRLGIIIDVDHMSERALRATVALAAAVPGKYPLVMGHNAPRAAGGNERGAPPDVLEKILASGGMLGIGTADGTPRSVIGTYRNVQGLMRRRGLEPGALAIGTDVNGFEPLPHHDRTGDLARQSADFYGRFLRESGIASKSARPSGPAFDYITEGGVSHYGLMPEFMWDIKTQPGGNVVHEGLMGSVEYLAGMWTTIERRASGVSSAPRGGTYSSAVQPLQNLCPYWRVSGDGEFGGNGPSVEGSVTLGISPDGTSLVASVKFAAKETRSDWSEVRGEWSLPVGEPAPAGMRYVRLASPSTSAFLTTLHGGGRNEVFEGCDGAEHVITPSNGPVARLIVVGDTGGGDISTDADCNCDTRIVRIEWNAVNVTLAPR
jgi:microsomal dipeptidase-like Zn-dependent dipeptidase